MESSLVIMIDICRRKWVFGNKEVVAVNKNGKGEIETYTEKTN
jgi:hypothetical protein